jgi:hypothetical protein
MYVLNKNYIGSFETSKTETSIAYQNTILIYTYTVKYFHSTMVDSLILLFISPSCIIYTNNSTYFTQMTV